MNRRQILSRAIGMALSAGLLVVPFSVTMPQFTVFASEAEAAAAVGAQDVVLVGSLQSKLGAAKDWDPAAPATIMKSLGNGKYQFKGTLPAGNYEFKIAIGGGWDTNYGADGAANGKNMELRLTKAHEVTFTYDAASHAVTYAYEGMQTEQAEIQKSLAQRSFVVTGTIQTKVGAAKDWDPGDTKARMQEAGHSFYTYTADLPAGNYYYKISVNGSWAENYGLGGNFDGANVQMNLEKPEKVTFYYNDKTHKIKDSTNYKMLKEDELPVLGGDLAGSKG